MASTHRVNRVRELLQRELGDIVMRMRDPRVAMATVVGTEVSRDLHYATMYVSVMGGEEEQRAAVEALERALGHIRSEVARRVQLRIVPEIRVVHDNTMERAAHLTALIDSVNQQVED